MKLIRNSRFGFGISSKGFTLVELLVSLAIFAIMTALLVAKYGNFNQSVLLTDLAYDVALSIRTAQTYGTSVKAIDSTTNVSGDVTGAFQNAYGVHFDTSTGRNTTVTIYSKSLKTLNGTDYYYIPGADPIVTTYAVKRNGRISGVCSGTIPSDSSSISCTPASGVLDIVFVRPDPSAIICNGTDCTSSDFAQVTVSASDNSTRNVTVIENGQISVGN